jgi:hypothetical protein
VMFFGVTFCRGDVLCQVTFCGVTFCRGTEKRCKGCKYFSEIRRISENDWQLILRFIENVLQHHTHVSKTVVNPSRRFVESPRRFGVKHQNLK